MNKLDLKKEIEAKGGHVIGFKKNKRYMILLDGHKMKIDDAQSMVDLMDKMKIQGFAVLINGDVNSAVKVFEVEHD